MNEIKLEWDKLIKWANDHAPHLLNSLNDKADNQKIEECKKIIGYEDSELWTLYSVADGNKIGAPTYPIPGLRILSTSEIIESINFMRGLSIEMDYSDSQGGVTVMQKDLVRPEYILQQHILFATDGTGNYLALDFAPKALGKIGQVINIGVGEEKRYVVTSDLAHLFCIIRELLEGGQFYVNENRKDRRLACFDPDCYLFLDALHKMYELDLLV